MKNFRRFKVTVRFDLKNEKVVNCLMNNFSLDEMSEDGTVEMSYRGNSKSSEQTAIAGIKKILNTYESFKRGFQILGAREITK